MRPFSWPGACRTTIALWLFVLLIFLPIIGERHAERGWTSVALDGSTVLFSMALGLTLFLPFKWSVGLPGPMQWLVRALAVIAAAALNTGFDLIFQAWIADHVTQAWQTLPADFRRAYSSTLNYLLVFGVNMMLYHVNHTRRAWMAQELRVSAANSMAQEAQLAALRYQLNPHFLFNALNSISSLIVTKRNEDAEEMTQRLCSFLRGSISIDANELIPLEDELSLTQEYLEVERVRFGDRLAIAIDSTDEAGAVLVPGFLVQPLVENAVKHGVARSNRQMEIRIEARTEGGFLNVTVSNGLPPTSADRQRVRSAGVGLANIRRRLNALFGTRAALDTDQVDGRFVATLRIPASLETYTRLG
ncbi:histidine kinase [Allosphingosinicella flava]|uniref:Histidine kinase n=1 Tax=Allosphingosinicella flava TaxID=2771430 RepID=A0A7T2GK77_9SPHN|nr:histidine kinase [Sphingosinicella flava]QPQ55023.1 histidine kinase [Sphingosinicella flava]